MSNRFQHSQQGCDNMEPGTLYAGSLLINAVLNMFNGSSNREQQEKLAKKNQEFSEKMEANRQDFQLEVNRRNAENQRELSVENHRLRLVEQKNNFKLMCQQAEWQHFLTDWPLKNLPSVIREDQILSDDTIALRVFFSKSKNEFFSKNIYPTVEQGLREFVNLYHNEFNSRNITFYHEAYKDGVYGGAFNKNIKHALRDLPVIIIDTNVVLDKTIDTNSVLEKICVSATIWGFDDVDGREATLFKLPFKTKSVDGKKMYTGSPEMLANAILAHLKFVLGYVYDTYNLIMYDRSPLLPKVARREFENNVDGAFLRYKNIQSSFAEQYGNIYSSVLGKKNVKGNLSFAELPQNFKKTILYNLRLEYALAVKDLIKPEDFQEYLNDSIKSWCELRTTLPAIDFLKSLKGNKEKILKYFSAEDVDYFKKLCSAYEALTNKTSVGEACLALKEDVLNLESEIANAQKNKEVVIPAIPKPARRNYLTL